MDSDWLSVFLSFISWSESFLCAVIAVAWTLLFFNTENILYISIVIVLAVNETLE